MGIPLLVVALAISLNLTDGLQLTVPDYTAALQKAIELPGAPQQLKELTAAPELTGITAWLNTPKLSIADLRGKVVLINFWTYSCINCQRALPHIQAREQTYRDSGLIVIGVHTPEFAFEHDISNVTDQARAPGMRYPVAIDNDYATWKAYKNRYWPPST
ncbi:redoxin domain-containing protein [Kibdelosporangium philippinense]|uniref:Redoxin domain-containing protein n=1 Tax=Kibdelosporangium philippinense TaxID=211113 RepID=A0ABS8ZTE1_9PSEU|nr:redoxin domain-containing protein [Kibdelosporangium philippinense]MCE7010255.1 redoxin domain-containing protein [Kibdelosporangium philippinense]